MSVQIALLAPATRVASRKLGPWRARGQPASRRAERARRPARRARWRARAAGARRTPSGDRASRRRSRSAARRSARSRRAGARTAPRGARASGVRYQSAPSNRSSRACSTPAVSAPASGCPPMKRGSRPASATARLVEPTSLTTQSGPARRERVARRSPRARRRGGDEHDVRARDRAGDVRGLRVDRAQLQGACAAPRDRGHSRCTLRRCARAGGQADRAADQPDARGRRPSRRR